MPKIKGNVNVLWWRVRALHLIIIKSKWLITVLNVTDGKTETDILVTKSGMLEYGFAGKNAKQNSLKSTTLNPYTVKKHTRI